MFFYISLYYAFRFSFQLFFLCSFFLAAKNRTSSPSSASSQPTNIGNKISVSSSNFKREASPTVCCYNINSRSQSFLRGDQSEGNFDTFASAQRLDRETPSSAPTFSSNLATLSNRNRSQIQTSPLATTSSSDGRGLLIQNRENISEKTFSHLKDKIRRFENPPNNIQENIKNRSTTSTTIRAEAAAANVDPVKSVSENDQRISDDKNSRFGRTLLINRDESQSKRCNWGFVSDGNNNQVQEVKNRHDSDTVNSFKSSLTARQLRDINTRCGVDGDDIKVTKVVIRHLTPAVDQTQPVETASQSSRPQVAHKQSSLDDNDFSFIDSSSRSVSRSSSTSFASDELGLCDEKVNQRSLRVPKISRINNSCNNSHEFSVRTCANQNIFSLNQSENNSVQNGWDATSHRKAHLSKYLEKPKNGQHLKVPTNSYSTPNSNQSSPEKSVSSNFNSTGCGKSLFSLARRTIYHEICTEEDKCFSLNTDSSEPTRIHSYRAVMMSKEFSASSGTFQ